MTDYSFIYSALPTRVVFGRGKLKEAAAEAKRLGMARPLIITGRNQADAIRPLLAETGGVAFTDAAMHTPVDVTEQALAIVKAEACDGTIALGGGSSHRLAAARDPHLLCRLRDDQHPRRDGGRRQDHQA